MRVGLLGGSFDPVHIGHLAMAELARDHGGLDQVWMLPAAAPPHKPNANLAAFNYRHDMLQLALAGHETVRPEPIEGTLPPPSFTIRTVQALMERHPDHRFSLVLGSDTLADFPNWHKTADLAELLNSIVVMPRPGFPVLPMDELVRRLGVVSRVMVLEGMPTLDISSSWLRKSIETGRSVRFLVPRAVEQFIKEHGLYGYGSGTPARGSG
jgi:nicotinate-nucleotide adenylyltransferase